MEASDFLPDRETVEQIRRDLAAYEERRKVAHAAARSRMRLYVWPFIAASLLAVIFMRGFLFDERYFVLGVAVLGGLGFGGIKLYDFARRPAVELQESFRADLFRSIFGFIQNLRHWRGSVPASFSRLPITVTGTFTSETFDDEISGRMGDLRFELYEARLERKSGKSSRTVFNGVVLAFDLAQPFEGRLIATRRIGNIARMLRDAFKGEGLRQVSSGHPALDELYEFRTDNEAAAVPLIRDRLGKALDWLKEAWPDEPARIALSDRDGFLLLPVTGYRNFFELPDIAVPLDYPHHVAPIITDMGKLLAIGELVRKAVVQRD